MLDTRKAVHDRYTEGARRPEPALCCPVEYDPQMLALLPQEIIERDYGCGDPSRHVRPGDTVLDLGCGGGKICYLAAQRVGPEGRVIGIDMNDEMLALARRYQAEMAERLGGDRVRFLKGYIEDLALDLDRLAERLAEHPVRSPEDLAELEAWQRRQRLEAPLVADESVDLVLSNCVLNLVDESRKSQLFREIFRVLRPGGRVAISDIVSDRPVPEPLKQDPALWSGCISGALQETEFVRAFVEAGFQAVYIDGYDTTPWRVVEGIAFRSLTLLAVKPEAEAGTEGEYAVIYRGPFAEVRDEEGKAYPRGVRVAVDAVRYRHLTGPAYGERFIGLPPDAGEEKNAEGQGGCETAGCCC